MNKYNILYTSDSNYFCHMITSIFSLVENNKNMNLVIHIIEDNFTYEQITMLHQLETKYNIEIKLYSFKQIAERIKKYNIPKWRDSDIANARLFTHEIIRDVDKLLYLDSDTIILNSLLELFNNDFKTPLAAVKEFFVPSHVKNVLNSYYNSGVILFDYEKWEKEDCTKKLCDGIKNNNIELEYPDQDLLNLNLQNFISTLNINYNINPYLYIYDKYPLLAKRYYKNLNNFYSYEEICDALKNPYILHMLSYLGARPWIKNKIHPFNDIYQNYRLYWDSNFTLEDIDNIYIQMKILPFIKTIADSFLSKEKIEEMKCKTKIKNFRDY